ncbi:MAG: hypothetical protein R3E83_24120 [Burkholderiaceae bacterium]
MILRPRVLLIAIGTGLFWLLALVAPLVFLAGWRIGHQALLVGGALATIGCLLAYRVFRAREAALKRWAGDD